MVTSAFKDIPEIEWEVDQSRSAMIDDHGEIKIYPATGESADGRKWMASADVLYGEDTEIDLDSIEEQ